MCRTVTNKKELHWLQNGTGTAQWAFLLAAIAIGFQVGAAFSNPPPPHRVSDFLCGLRIFIPSEFVEIDLHPVILLYGIVFVSAQQ
jgi:hypothetical protein